jgi:zinc protease
VTTATVGSKDEKPGKTGFAHLFEHMMFKGSAHVADGLMDLQFEEAGGWTNAFTSSDQTVYQDMSSSNFLEPALFFEADRLAGLTDTLDKAKLDNQREVVLNERRQSYENQPYGMSWILIAEALWPKAHGYHWSTIGYPADLNAASVDDVKSFFKQYYVPNNAVMVIAGDVDPKQTETLVRKYLGWIPRGADPVRPQYKTPAPITKEIKIVATDDVQVPRVHLVWRAPAGFSPESAKLDVTALVLGYGKSSRLYKRLVITDRLAQDVEVFYDDSELAGAFYIIATAKPGAASDKLIAAISDELVKLGKTPPTDEELERVKNAHESDFLYGLEPIMSRAIRLSFYVVRAGDADYLAKDLARYRAVTGKDVSAAVGKWLTPSSRVALTINPEKK